MRYTILPFLILALGAPSVYAQQYNTALGLRLGSEMGISLQQRIGRRFTVEGLVQHGLSSNATTFTGLLEKHYPILGRNMNLYLGAGPHVGFQPSGADKGEGGRTGFAGASVIAGGELRLNRLLFSVDYKPAIHFAGRDKVFDGQTGVSVRYILAKAPAKKQRINWPFGKQKKSNKATASDRKWPFGKA